MFLGKAARSVTLPSPNDTRLHSNIITQSRKAGLTQLIWMHQRVFGRVPCLEDVHKFPLHFVQIYSGVKALVRDRAILRTEKPVVDVPSVRDDTVIAVVQLPDMGPSRGLPPLMLESFPFT